MIGLIMAGGLGSRMSLDEEKLILIYKKPIILHVVDAMRESKCFSRIIAVTSPNSPKTKQLLQMHNIEVYSSPGSGYASDINKALKTINDSVLVISGDLPLLDKDIIQTMVSFYNPKHIWTSILVTEKFLDSLKISTEYRTEFNHQFCCYSGISLVNATQISNLEKIPEKFIILDDKRIGFNLNTKSDYDSLCAS